MSIAAKFVIGVVCGYAVFQPVIRDGSLTLTGQKGSVREVGESCWVGKDLVVQALEHMHPSSTSAQLDDANQLLKRAISMCDASGDAWYFRSLVEARLGRAPLAVFAMKHAAMFPSDALTDQVNPLILSTPTPKGLQILPPVQQKWALIIGIGSFVDPNVPALKYTNDDAKSFYDVLVDPKYGGFKPENVRALSDGDATLGHIKGAINWLARQAGPDDLVVVYLATHGSSRGLDTREANYIITNDTILTVTKDSNAPYDKPADALYATALPMVELANAISTRLKARRTAIFLDTCHSGGAFSEDRNMLAPGIAGGSVSSETLERATEGSGRIIFAASKRDEQSWESTNLGHGYFTYYLVNAIREHPDMPLSKIFTSVQKNVSLQVSTDHQNLDQQTPVMNRSADGPDFALGNPRPSAVARLDSLKGGSTRP